MTTKRVVLFVDNSKRDLLATRMLEIAFQKRGAKTALCNHKNWRAILRQNRPHAVMVSRGDLRWAQKASECCHVYVVPSEGARLTKETMLSVFVGRAFFKLERTDWIRRCYLWNENTAKWLLELNFREDQLKVVGNFRLDPYKYIKRNRRIVGKPDDFVLGVAFSAGSTSTYSGPIHHAKTYYHFHPDLNFPIIRKNRHYESIVWRDHAILRRIMRCLRRYLETMPGKILFRPSPFEDPREYMFLQRLYPDRVRVADTQEFIDWVSQVDAVLTCWSTSGIEALLNGIPVISIFGLFDKPQLFDHLDPQASGFCSFVPFYHTPETEEGLFETIRQAQENRLPLSPRSGDEIKKLLFDIYSWPYARNASDQIADDVLQDLEGMEETPQEKWHEALPLPYNLPISLSRFVYDVAAMGGYIMSGAFKSQFGFHRTSNPEVERVLKRIYRQTM